MPGGLGGWLLGEGLADAPKGLGVGGGPTSRTWDGAEGPVGGDSLAGRSAGKGKVGRSAGCFPNTSLLLSALPASTLRGRQ